MARKILLNEWAKEEFGEPIPSIKTLTRYAKNNMINPPAIKEGRRWRVDKDARYVGMLTSPVITKNDNPVLKRILSDG